MNAKFFLLSLLFVFTGQLCRAQPHIRLRYDEPNQKVDVWYDDDFFTSYAFADRYRKVSFYPIMTPSGNYVTRGFPYQARPHEHADHPHQIGLTFIFGDVNGVDFWNNSYARSEADAYKYGTIRNKKITRMEEGIGKAVLAVETEWLDYKGNVLLTEEVTYLFTGDQDSRSIERYGQLTAANGDVEFKDNKEGLWFIRFDKAFEEPQTRPELHTDAWGYTMSKPSIHNEGAQGTMRNAEGDEKEAGTFSKPTRWLSNSTFRNGERLTAVLMDHKENVGYPARAFSRGYGMMALNNLGTQCYSPDAEPFYFKLPKGERIGFKHKFTLIWGREVPDSEIETIFEAFNAPSF